MAAKVLLVLMALAVMCHAGSTKKENPNKGREMVFSASDNESITMSPQAILWTSAIFIGLLAVLGLLGVAPLAGLFGREGTAAPIDFASFAAPAPAYPGEKTTFTVHHALDQGAFKFQ